MSEFFSPDELRELTGTKPVGRQEAWLKDHGIPHRRDGNRLIVCRVHVRSWIEGRPLLVSSCEPTFDRPF